MIIDTHTHLGSDDLVAYPRDQAKPIHTGDYDNTAERFLDLMDEAGVDGAIVVQAFGLYGFDNAYHADSAQRFPQRFAGVGGLSPDLPDAPGLLRYWVKDRGMAGVRLSYWGPGPGVDPQDPNLLAVVAEADALGVPVTFLTTRKNLAAIRALAVKFDGLKVAVDHLGVGLGEPERVEADVMALAGLPNLFLKFSTPILTAGEPHASFFERVVAHVGVEQLMWSSDFPHTDVGGYANMVRFARQRLGFLSAAERERVFSGTALQLWPQLSGARARAPA
jgi:predicted TIM-barrel fold metal-dependent hydrolase